MNPTRRGFLKGVAAIAAGLYFGVGSALKPIYAPEREEHRRSLPEVLYVGNTGICGDGTSPSTPLASIYDALEMAGGCDDGALTIFVLPGHYEMCADPIEVSSSNTSIIGLGGDHNRPVFDFTLGGRHGRPDAET